LDREIDIRQLREIINHILDHVIDDLRIEKLAIDEKQDFYWDISDRHVYCVEKRPSELDVGRLTDDWEFLCPLSKDRSQAVPLMLTHVVPILKFIGEKVGP
jgi:hypothetical protein